MSRKGDVANTLTDTWSTQSEQLLDRRDMRAVMRLDESIVIQEEVGLRGIHKEYASHKNTTVSFIIISLLALRHLKTNSSIFVM